MVQRTTAAVIRCLLHAGLRCATKYHPHPPAQACAQLARARKCNAMPTAPHVESTRPPSALTAASTSAAAWRWAWYPQCLLPSAMRGIASEPLVRFSFLHKHAEQEPMRKTPFEIDATGAVVHARLSPRYSAARVGRNAQPILLHLRRWVSDSEVCMTVQLQQCTPLRNTRRTVGE